MSHRKGTAALAAYRKSGKKPPKRPRSTGKKVHVAGIGSIRIISKPYASKGNFYIHGNSITYKPNSAKGRGSVVVIQNGVKTSHMTDSRMGRLLKQGACMQ